MTNVQLWWLSAADSSLPTTVEQATTSPPTATTAEYSTQDTDVETSISISMTDSTTAEPVFNDGKYMAILPHQA